MMIKYSVIVPIYNSEKTLARCVESLVNQKREDIQIVLINDGSTDHSEEIALQYAEKYPVIDYLYQDNAGVSHARNTGIEHARGTYITFVDSDDYVAEDYFATLDQAEDCDLLVFAHENVGGFSLDESGLFEELQALKTAEQRLELLLSSRKIMSPWNKRFRLSIIRDNSLRFIEGLSVGEDFNFCTAYAMHSQTIQISGRQIICNDISDQGSLSRRYRPHLDDQLVFVFTNIADTIANSIIYQTDTAKLLTIVDYLYVKHTFSCISEEFKVRKLNYFKDRKDIVGICQKFRRPLSESCCNIVHRALRLALKWKLYFPFYFVSYWVKGRKYKT